MAAIGGSIESVTLEGRTYAVAADADSNRKVGGFENEVEANGDLSARLIKTVVPSQFDGLTLSCDDLNGDHEFLQSLSDLKDFFDATVVFVSGAIWQGFVQITGELNYSSQSSTCSVTLKGTGRVTQQ